MLLAANEAMSSSAAVPVPAGSASSLSAQLEQIRREMTEFDGTGEIELTLAMIKPDAFDRATEIEERILKEGFSIVKVNWFTKYLLVCATVLNPVVNSAMTLSFGWSYTSAQIAI